MHTTTLPNDARIAVIGGGPAGIANAKELAELSSDDPTSVKLVRRTGEIFAEIGDVESALKWYRRALEVNPNMLGVEMNIRMIEERMKAHRRPGQST